jgi:hypothetical protein
MNFFLYLKLYALCTTIHNDINKCACIVIPAKAGIQKTGWIPGQARNDRPQEVVVNMRKNLGRFV